MSPLKYSMYVVIMQAQLLANAHTAPVGFIQDQPLNTYSSFIGIEILHSTKEKLKYIQNKELICNCNLNI